MKSTPRIMQTASFAQATATAGAFLMVIILASGCASSSSGSRTLFSSGGATGVGQPNATGKSASASEQAVNTRTNSSGDAPTDARSQTQTSASANGYASAPSNAEVTSADYTKGQKDALTSGKASSLSSNALDTSDSIERIDMRVSSSEMPDYEMLVESKPLGAQVVVDGVPVAKTPCRLVMSGSPAGFCLNAVSIKVRFIAKDAGEKSHTVEELFTRLDKIPARLCFTPSGTVRVLADASTRAD